MPFFLTNRQLIALALPHLSEQELELVQGVRKTLTTLGNAHELLVLSGGYEPQLRKLASSHKLAGVIGSFMSPLWLESLLHQDIPVVQLGTELTPNLPSVEPDWQSMGREAAAALLHQGVRAMAYLGASAPSDSAQLLSAFQATCHERGVTLRVSHESSPAVLREFLSSLTLPCGLLCSWDRLVRLAMQAAQHSGLSIPGDLALIGVGNSRMESLHAGMEISSFELPLREIGLQAGSLMMDLLKGNRISPMSYRLPTTLHERDTSIRAASGVSKAIAYLKSNPATEMNAGDLARFAGMSRRSFEMAISRDFGLSPGVLLQEIRRSRAEKLLSESDESISEIGKQCGYHEVAVFSAAFKRWTGLSPRAYRNQQKAQLPSMDAS